MTTSKGIADESSCRQALREVGSRAQVCEHRRERDGSSGFSPVPFPSFQKMSVPAQCHLILPCTGKCAYRTIHRRSVCLQHPSAQRGRLLCVANSTRRSPRFKAQLAVATSSEKLTITTNNIRSEKLDKLAIVPQLVSKFACVFSPRGVSSFVFRCPS